MQNLITQQTSQLEKDLLALHTGNEQAKIWFAQSVKSLLEIPTLSVYAKTDTIAEAFENIDLRLQYIKEQQYLLVTLKKQFETAKALAKQEIANYFTSLGVTKIEGMRISSITVSDAVEKPVAQLEIYDEDALIRGGYFTVVLDREAVKNALLSADQREEVSDFADMKIEVIQKPTSIRINKRKISVQNDTPSIAA